MIGTRRKSQMSLEWQTDSCRPRCHNCNMFVGTWQDTWLSYTSVQTHPTPEMRDMFFVHCRLLVDNQFHMSTLQLRPQIWPTARWPQTSRNRTTRHTLCIDQRGNHVFAQQQHPVLSWNKHYYVGIHAFIDYKLDTNHENTYCCFTFIFYTNTIDM